MINFLIIPIFLLKQIYEFPSRDPRVATAVSFAVMNEFRGRVYYSQSGDEQLEVLHQIPFHTTFSAVVKTWSKNSGSSIRLYKVSSKGGLLEGLDELRFLCVRSLSELNNVKNDIVNLGKRMLAWWQRRWTTKSPRRQMFVQLSPRLCIMRGQPSQGGW